MYRATPAACISGSSRVTRSQVGPYSPTDHTGWWPTTNSQSAVLLDSSSCTHAHCASFTAGGTQEADTGGSRGLPAPGSSVLLCTRRRPAGLATAGDGGGGAFTPPNSVSVSTITNWAVVPSDSVCVWL